MDREAKPAVVFIRMSPQLRDGLRVAAGDARCSLNAFVVQVLAAAAGDPSRFRVPRAHDEAAEPELERDALGYPLDRRARGDHIAARTDYIAAMCAEMTDAEVVVIVKKHDAEDPGYFVEWARLRRVEHAAREREGHRGAA
jgi:hypothetical protein